MYCFVPADGSWFHVAMAGLYLFTLTPCDEILSNKKKIERVREAVHIWLFSKMKRVIMWEFHPPRRCIIDVVGVKMWEKLLFAFLFQDATRYIFPLDLAWLCLSSTSVLLFACGGIHKCVVK